MFDTNELAHRDFERTRELEKIDLPPEMVESLDNLIIACDRVVESTTKLQEYALRPKQI